jgi:hypothetical protein
MHYYGLKRHWTRNIEPHLSDARLNQILCRDFGKYTYGRWRQRFKPGQFPPRLRVLRLGIDHRGREPRFWQYVKHSACHWLVNFNLRLAQLAEPGRPWRILTSDDHSTVWDGGQTLFDLNYLAFGIPADECFALANGEEYEPGRELKVHLAGHFSEDT